MYRALMGDAVLAIAATYSAVMLAALAGRVAEAAIQYARTPCPYMRVRRRHGFIQPCAYWIAGLGLEGIPPGGINPRGLHLWEG